MQRCPTRMQKGFPNRVGVRVEVHCTFTFLQDVNQNEESDQRTTLIIWWCLKMSEMMHVAKSDWDLLSVSWAAFWFTSRSKMIRAPNPSQRLTDLFPGRTFLVAGMAVAYLHICHLCFSAQSKPWVRQGWGVPQHTWSQWPIPGSRSSSADLPHLRIKKGEAQLKDPPNTQSIWVWQSPQAFLRQRYLWVGTKKTTWWIQVWEDALTSYFIHIPFSYNTKSLLKIYEIGRKQNIRYGGNKTNVEKTQEKINELAHSPQSISVCWWYVCIVMAGY